MNRYFKAYSKEQRAKVESDAKYQEAEAREDVVKCQEIAHAILEGEIERILLNL